jgi:hypothetical protein
MNDLVLFLIICGVSVGAGVIGCAIGIERYQQSAIDHNAAEWRIDPKTGEKTFVWLPRQTESKP